MQNSNIIHMQCPNCMGSVKRNGDGSATCEYCGASFMLQDQSESESSEKEFKDKKKKKKTAQAASTPVRLGEYFNECWDDFEDDPPMDWWAGNGLDEKGAQKRLAMADRIGVPDGATVFLLMDTTLMGSMKIGIACTPDGVYYCDEDKKKGLISWDDFPNYDVREKDGNFFIDKHKFIISEDDAEDLADVLCELQDRIELDGYAI